MKLTRRQEEFINKLLELHQEFEGPIHYSLLAERLGVSPFTAYDMLCVLEDKGVVTSEFQLASNKSGPGRAERVFYPVESIKAREQRMAREAGGADLEGDELKHFILDKMRKGEGWDHDLAREILARIPPHGSGKIRYCVEVMTIAALRLQLISDRRILLEYLPDILPKDVTATRGHLSLLGGFTFGILAKGEFFDEEWSQMLFDHIKRSLNLIAEMDSNECRQLGELLTSVITPLIKDEETS
jgi:hypothetical protein